MTKEVGRERIVLSFAIKHVYNERFSSDVTVLTSKDLVLARRTSTRRRRKQMMKEKKRAKL